MDRTSAIPAAICLHGLVSHHLSVIHVGLAAWLMVLETFDLVTGEPVYRRVFEFWLKIFIYTLIV